MLDRVRLPSDFPSISKTYNESLYGGVQEFFTMKNMIELFGSDQTSMNVLELQAFCTFKSSETLMTIERSADNALLHNLSFLESFNDHRFFSLVDLSSTDLMKITDALSKNIETAYLALPDAHVQAPTGGSVILAAIMLKMGGYGFFRFSLPITPDASLEFSEIVIILSLIAIVYIGFVALVQRDMKKLIAYSSISHMGFVTLGVFALFLAYTPGAAEGALLGLEGAMIQMISHGFISAAMFLVVGVLYDRLHSREISTYGGIINSMPKFTGFAVLFAMANAGLPGTSGFVGEFMVILGVMQANIWYAVLAGTTLIVGAAYTLWMVKRVFWGEVTNPAVSTLSDINAREFGILTILAVAVVAMGLYPQPVIDVMHVSIEHLLNQALTSKL